MIDKCGVEYFSELPVVLFPQFDGDKTRGGGCHGSIEESKHEDDAAYYIVYPVIDFSQGI